MHRKQKATGKPMVWRLRARLLSLLIASFVILPASSLAQYEDPLPPGTYRLEMIIASITRVPFFGTSKSASRSVSLVAITSVDGALVQSHQVCDFRVLQNSAMIKMLFPDKFVAALGKQSYPIEVEKDGQGWRYRADLGLERIGYKHLPGESALPATADDPSVYDWDNDGHPGATLKISVPLLPDGELYVVQRGQSILNGQITRPGRIEGTIEVRSFEHRVIDAWPGFLNRTPEIVPDPTESRFSMIAIPQGSNCDTLRGKAAQSNQKE